SLLASSPLSLVCPAPPRPPLSPYTTLFRSTPFAVSGAYIEQYLGGYPMQTMLGSWPLLIVPIFAAIMLLLGLFFAWRGHVARTRSEEHTSELQSRFDLVCRLLLENINKWHS